MNDPEVWEEDPDFLTATKRVAALKVINDDAERGVVLIHEYNKVLTKNEEQQLQAMLQVVENHCKQYPTAKRELLTGAQE